MECVLQVIRGNSLDHDGQICPFCGEEAICMFGLTYGKKYDGVVFKGFGVCLEHKDKLNALLSGEFDIDEIYLEKYRKTMSKKVRIRAHPPIRIAETKNKKTLKTCAFVGCENQFNGIAVQKYCTDQRCKEHRKAYAKSKGRKVHHDPEVKNLIIEKQKVGKRLKDNQVLRLQCRARDGNNCRCNNKLVIEYQRKRKTYPMFCEDHRSAYKRQRFSLQRGSNAKVNGRGIRRI